MDLQGFGFDFYVWCEALSCGFGGAKHSLVALAARSTLLRRWRCEALSYGFCGAKQSPTAFAVRSIPLFSRTPRY